MKKYGIMVAVVLILIIAGVGVGTYFYVDSQKSQSTEEGNTQNSKLVATFHGGSSEKTYETEIYKDDNGHANMGFTYINYECSTKRWGSSEIVRTVTGRGAFTWTDGAFEIARKNNAYSYVTVPDSSRTYSIEDFQSIFIMD